MYEQEKRETQEWFLTNFVGDDENDGTYVFEMYDRACAVEVHEEPEPAAVAMVDYEDEVSGGHPMCLRCFLRTIKESPLRITPAPQSWKDWTDGADLWFLFAAPGRYAKTGEWPYEGDK